MTNIRLSFLATVLPCLILLSSCSLFHPLPLKPIDDQSAPDRIKQLQLFDFNGDWEIMASDSSKMTMEYNFTNKDRFSYRKPPGPNDFIRLTAIDNHRLKAELYIDNKKVKTKKIKGRIRNDYFEYHSTHVECHWVVFFVYRQHTERIAATAKGELVMDSNQGGIAFLLILPIPLSGASMDYYNIRYRRRNAMTQIPDPGTK